MKKFGMKTLCICMAVSAVLLGGCGKAEETLGTNVEQSEAEETVNARPVKEIYEDIKQAVELHSPVEMADSFISNYYGIDPEKLEEYIFVMSEEATSAETIVIMKVKDEGDVEKISEALLVVVDEKRGEMENYLPEQFEIVDKSSVKSKGSYVYLVISESGDTIVQMIEEEL